MDWAQAQVRLQHGIALLLIAAALSCLPAALLENTTLLVVPAILVLAAVLNIGFWWCAERYYFVPIAIGDGLLGCIFFLAMPLFIFAGGGFIMLSPIALLDDSPNSDYHIEKALLRVFGSGVLYIGMGLLLGAIAWQLLRTVWLLWRGVRQA